MKVHSQNRFEIKPEVSAGIQRRSRKIFQCNRVSGGSKGPAKQVLGFIFTREKINEKSKSFCRDYNFSVRSCSPWSINWWDSDFRCTLNAQF
jgi:hypothetical protein